MSDLDNEIPGFDDFLLSAEEIRSSADSVIKDGINYNVQSNVARCLLSINENKATGEALVKIGLEDAIKHLWGGDFIFDVKQKIYKEKAIKSQPELFNDAFNQPDIFLTVLANTIDEIVERGFVCVIFNQFGMLPDYVERIVGEEFVASHFPNDESLTTKEKLHYLFHKYYDYLKDTSGATQQFYDIIWAEDGENIMPKNWNMILAPNLDLVINW